MSLPVPNTGAFGTPKKKRKKNNNNKNNRGNSSIQRAMPNLSAFPNLSSNKALSNTSGSQQENKLVKYITSDNFQQVLQPMTHFVTNNTTVKFAFTGSGAIALYAIFGYIYEIGSNFYGARVPNDTDIVAKFYSPGSSPNYKDYVTYNTIQGERRMNRRKMIKENENANIHLMPGNTEIVWLNIYGIDYPVVTIQFLLDKIDEYGNNKPIRRTINKPSLNKMTNSGRFLQNPTNTLSTGHTPRKKPKRRRNNN
jgi:hypothetical protein